jgi:hypothetical protein
MIHDTATGAELRKVELSADEGPPGKVVFSPDGLFLAIGMQGVAERFEPVTLRGSAVRVPTTSPWISFLPAAGWTRRRRTAWG